MSAAQRVAALVVGAGPAGLAAAETLAAAGHGVLVAEAKPSIGRKFLMAGKSGLNLTMQADAAACARAYGASEAWLTPIIAACPPAAIRAWAEGLGQPCFAGSTGRVFPRAMKASPLLRAWARRLDAGGVAIRTRWRWTGWDPSEAALFATNAGQETVAAGATILALGGASWSRLGADGAWASILGAEGVPLAPFAPSNAGLSVAWSVAMAPHFGAPVKGIAISAGPTRSRGEVVITPRGLEGGGIYALGPAIRAGAALRMDLVPARTEADLAARLARAGRASIGNRLRKAARIGGAAAALAQEWGRPLPADPAALAAALKALPVRHGGLRPLDEAISTAGGVRRDALGPGLMLAARPGVFAAGEMLDWDAPTGGYLLTACLATGRRAGEEAARWLDAGAR